jgi:hypothetical protein
MASDSESARRVILRSRRLWFAQAVLWLGFAVTSSSTASRALCLIAAVVSAVLGAALPHRRNAAAPSTAGRTRR